jgi:protein-S-isoprenylcysteine O-methyltransferase Ste14
MTDRSDTPGVIAPPPLIALITVALGLGLDLLLPAAFTAWPIATPGRIVVGALCMVAGGVLAIIAERAFHRIGTNTLPWRPALKLATGGIYAHMRNPMYVGLAAFVAGLGIALASFGTLLLLLPAALVMHFGVVLREERYLERKFGYDYRHFKAAVPRYGWK